MRGIFLVTLQLCCLAVFAGCSSNAPAPGTSGDSSATGVETQSGGSSIDLAKVKAFIPRVVVVTGQQLPGATEPVDSIRDWSINQRGQLAILADKESSNGRIESDLVLIDGKQTDVLLRQRGNPPYSDRVVQLFFGSKLNDGGSVLIQVIQEAPPGSQLYLVDAKQIQKVQQTRLLPRDPFNSEYIAGSKGHVAFVSREASGQPKPDLFWSDGNRTQVCASAHNDPFDPRRRFRGFGRLVGLNASGQLLFEASIQQDAESLIHNERLCLFTPTDKGKAVEGESLPGEVRELARQGEMLPGTDWTVSHDRDCWSSAILNDRGDVVFAQMESTGMGMVAGCIAVLPAESAKWQIVLRAQQPPGDPPMNIQAISFPSVNSQGQIACAVQVVDRKTQEYKQQLLRIQFDGKQTVLARSGDQLAAGVIVDGISAPHILRDGKVVYQATLRPPDFSSPREEALVISDGAQQRLILREADLSITGFQLPKIEQFQSSDAGHVGVKVKGDAFEDAILLVSPDFSSSQGK